MRNTLLTLSLCLPLSVQAADISALSEEARRLIAPLQQALQQSVQQAMQQGGALQAVASCQIQAPALTAAHSPAPWKVARTALRVRNPGNQPDVWEQQVLQRFSDRAAAGEPLPGMHEQAIVDGQFRYMQAIPTGQPCLTCHGEKLSPELAAKLDSLYPADQARGFKLGELRGAFTLSRPLESP
ncbi:DUF3365 domain-containing protein [Pseudomonas sp. HAR-UPW-AIA-41]|uniref:Tll0287-like domain-containing protein n=1 Tax=Pseudomonas sp. HAR-UPW-AIA-41 TaxID=1985301 RepID=UPI002115089C|nr:DUF3365 domain-containing protein [Pseudomonas sp. HAR-UPW-AIA-41]